MRGDLAFTTFGTEAPRTGSPVVFTTGDRDVTVLILGGTSGDAGMRYFLDIEAGVVGLISFDGEPQAEKINETLADFVAFLLQLRLRQESLTGQPKEKIERLTKELWISLQEADPVGFQHAEAWWPMVLDTLMERGAISEARAFLAQRRAEVAGNPAASDAAVTPS